jgi:hypothetical protein
VLGEVDEGDREDSGNDEEEGEEVCGLEEEEGRLVGGKAVEEAALGGGARCGDDRRGVVGVNGSEEGVGDGREP